MKKYWLHSLALTLGLLGASNAFGQYPNAYNNFGPSSYPVQSSQSMSVLQNVPQVPQNYGSQQNYSGQQNYAGQQNYVPQQEYVSPQNFASQQNVGTQQGVASQQTTMQQGMSQPSHSPYQLVGGDPVYQPPAPQPPAAPAMDANAAGCQSCGPGAAPGYSAYGYQPAYQMAPNTMSCGANPVSGTACAAPAAGGHFGIGRGLPSGAKPWFFGGGALFFNRIDETNIPLSFTDVDYSGDILGTHDAAMGVIPGFEASLGRYFNCGRNAIQATYWGLFSDTELALRSRPTGGDYRSRIPFTYLEMSDDPRTGPVDVIGVYDWFDGAYSHSLQRSSEYHNVEVNLLGFAMGGAARNFNMPTAGTMFSGLGGNKCGYCGGAGCNSCGASQNKFATGPCCLSAPSCGSRLNMTWIAGFRYFHFSDNLLYAASLQDSVINRGADDLYYEVNTTNDLFGAQFGSRLDYCIGKRLNTYASAKVGVYNNRANLMSSIGTDFERATLNDVRTPANPSNGQTYMFDETKNDLAFLSEIGTGLGIRVSSKWTATVGYRAVIAAGVATSTGNFRETFANYSTVRDFNNTDCLILHGLNVGGIYNF